MARKLSKKQITELREQEDKRMSSFRYLRNIWREEVLANAPAELRKILDYIPTVTPLEGEVLLEWLTQTDWLMNGDPSWRYLVLREISHRHDQLTQKNLDDPLPPETDWFLRAKAALRVR